MSTTLLIVAVLVLHLVAIGFAALIVRDLLHSAEQPRRPGGEAHHGWIWRRRPPGTSPHGQRAASRRSDRSPA